MVVAPAALSCCALAAGWSGFRPVAGAVEQVRAGSSRGRLAARTCPPLLSAPASHAPTLPIDSNLLTTSPLVASSARRRKRQSASPGQTASATGAQHRVGARRVVAIICAQSAWSRCLTGHRRHGARGTAGRADVVNGSGTLVSQRRIFCVRGASRNEMLPLASGKPVLRHRREAANSQAAASASGVTVRPGRMPFPPR